MGRPGRHRKKGRRKPCGRLAERKPMVEERVRIARRQPHRRGLGKSKDGRPNNLDERSESPLGRAFLTGLIDRESYDGATMFVAVVGAYRASIEAPRTTGGSGRGLSCANADLCRPYPEYCGCLHKRDRYTEAYEALAECGRAATREVVRVACQGEEVLDREALRLGSRALGRHFGFRAEGKR